MTSGKPAWTSAPPSTYDIVSCWYPEVEAPDDPGPELRPALVVKVYKGKKTGAYACEVAYGTKNLKVIRRGEIDLIISHPPRLQVGLARATRFDLDRIVLLPWEPPFFEPWTGNPTPKIGALTEECIRDYAFLMMKRQSA